MNCPKCGAFEHQYQRNMEGDFSCGSRVFTSDGGEIGVFETEQCFANQVTKLESRNRRLTAENKELRSLIEEAIEIWRPAESCFPDPDYQGRVESLGDEIGYGALMAAATYGWRSKSSIKGGEHVSGPCRAVLDGLMSKLRAALTRGDQ